MAAIDVSALGADLVEAVRVVSLVGVACLGVGYLVTAFRVLREMLEIGPSAGASGSGSGGMEAVYARAAAMAAAGEGQSDDFRHNTVTAAYDAGYSGKALEANEDPATLAAWNDGNDARREDEIRYGDK